MRPDQEAALRTMQEDAIDMALDEHAAARRKSLDTKADRGDRGWLTGMAAKSVGLAVKIEQFFQLRGERKLDPDDDDAETEAMVRRASAQVQKILEAAKAGPTERPKRGKRTPSA